MTETTAPALAAASSPALSEALSPAISAELSLELIITCADGLEAPLQTELTY